MTDAIKIFGTFGEEICNVHFVQTAHKNAFGFLYITSYHYFFFCGASARFRVIASNYGASRSHPFDTQHPVGILWTSDQPDGGTSTCQHTTVTRDRLPYLRWDSKPQSQQTSSQNTARSLGSAVHQVPALSHSKQQCGQFYIVVANITAGKWDSIPSRRRDCLFSVMSRPALGPTIPAIQPVTENIPQGVNIRGTYN